MMTQNTNRNLTWAEQIYAERWLHAVNVALRRYGRPASVLAYEFAYDVRIAYEQGDVNAMEASGRAAILHARASERMRCHSAAVLHAWGL